MLHSYSQLGKSIFGHQRLIVASWIVLILLVGGCAPAEQESASTPAAADGTAPGNDGQEAEGTADNVIAVDPLSLEQAVPPVNITMPDIELAAAVEAMGWTVAEEDGKRTTKWTVPDSAAGWHVNSAGAGGSGNVILSGHQLQGDAVFAPISLGDAAVGQQVLLEDEEGVVFIYEVVDVSDPIPVNGASAEEETAALAYVTDDGEARLTLITGWPEFTTTHRVFVQAVLSGVLK